MFQSSLKQNHSLLPQNVENDLFIVLIVHKLTIFNLCTVLLVKLIFSGYNNPVKSYWL